MKRTLLWIAACAVAVLPLSAAGSSETAMAGREGDTPVNNAWIRASVPGDRNAAGYMVIRNRNAEPKRLIRVESDGLAGRIELHGHTMVDGLMRMEQMPHIEVPPRGEIILEPGGYHLMFIGITDGFREGDIHRLRLFFDTIDPVEVDFIVEPITYRGPEMGAGDHGGAHSGE
ncbi:MAG TPA: copper chaperone PCu(A)C [Spirochaetia bacterium]|nr:copper chaperone PCu(A)C [Spirochaetia bacterium]